jgi:hypothetical protein
MQMLRGGVYLRDGAIQNHELFEKRHRLDIDRRSWHLLVLDHLGGVCGCARYTEYPAKAEFSDLSISRSALAQSSSWGKRLRTVVDDEMDVSRRLGVPFVELGGWALVEEVRGTTEALRLALSTYGLAQTLGGGVGISTATSRNSSALILRRLGGHPLEFERQEMPAYHDPQYGCEMEALRFYSWTPSPRYVSWIVELKHELRQIPVVTNGAFDEAWAFRGVRLPNPTVSGENSRSFIV